MICRTLRTALILCSLACAGFTARAACPPEPTVPTQEQVSAWMAKAPDRGLLWRVTRDGHSSYLYGSLHVGMREWVVPGPALRAAWADTEVLAVELDPADVLPVIAKLPPPAPLPEALARRMQAQARAACLPDGAIANLPLMLQLSTLMLFEARRDGLDAAFGQDMMLLGLAKAQGRPVQSLESVEEQLEALSGGVDEVSLLDAGLRQLHQGRVRAPMRKMAQAWSRGDLAMLGGYARWCACVETPAERAWYKRLNDDRNVNLAERIDALHAAGQRLFIAVGALHMSGPEALPRLLAARGFEVQALVPARGPSK